MFPLARLRISLYQGHAAHALDIMLEGVDYFHQKVEGGREGLIIYSTFSNMQNNDVIPTPLALNY